MVRPTDKPPSLRAQALAWLAQREHSRQELGAKLARWVAARQREGACAGVGESDIGREGSGEGWLGYRRQKAAVLAAPPTRVQGRATDEAEAEVLLPSTGEIESLLDSLEHAGHLSDRRFVESRVRVRAPRFGNLRIQFELRQLGARADEATLAQLKASEAERARSVWAAKFGQAPAGAAERARQIRFLAGRGFSAETIRSVLMRSADEE